MTVSNGTNGNGRNGRMWVIGGSFAGLGSLITALAFVVNGMINASVGPVKTLTDRLDVQLNAPVFGIQAFATARGVQIQQIEKDLKELKDDQRAMRDEVRSRLDRIEQVQRSQQQQTR